MIDKNGDKINLKEYFDLAIKAQDEKTTAILKGQQIALELAKKNMDYRLEEMNNFRKDMQRMETSFLTREAFEIKHELMQKQVDELRLSRAELQGKADQKSVNWILGISVIGLVISIISVITRLLK